MTEFPTNPEDVAAQLSTAGDEWRDRWTPADRLTEAGVIPRNGQLFYLPIFPPLFEYRPLKPHDFERFGIARVGPWKWNFPRIDPNLPLGAKDTTFTAAFHDDNRTMSVYGDVEKRWYWYDV